MIIIHTDIVNTSHLNDILFLPFYINPSKYRIDNTLYHIQTYHQHRMIDKQQISKHYGTCSLDICEVSQCHIDSVEDIS